MDIKTLTRRLSPYIPYVLALVPVMLFREFTPRNELRYLTIVDEALRDSHFWSFTFEGEPYADKPPLYFWLLMLARWLFGEHLRFVVCLFSLVPALGILAVMQRWTRESALQYFNGRLAWWVLATCGLQLGMAVFARMDMLMSFWITCALYLFWQWLHSQPDRQPRLSWYMGMALFMALFSKGPLGILIPLVATSAYLLVSRKARLLPRVWNWRVWSVLVAGCLLWWTCVYLEAGSDYINNMLFHQTVDRAVDSFHHQRPWWFYLVTTWYTTLPWGPLCIVATAISLYKGTWRSHPLQAFFVVAFISTLTMLSLISGKLDVYLLPAYPYLVYGGMMQFCQWDGTGKAQRIIVRICHVLMAIIFVAGLLIPLLYDRIVQAFA